MNDARRSPADSSSNDEPELGAEESVPLDGKDPVGEKMIEDLGRERSKDKDKDKNEHGDADPGPLPEQLPVS
ncbi:hypothetical protein QTH87_14015 [Variovorax sp. J22P168]|uniref:hypothetical protein n=1 Tax=Variovorax jilinensis TaxID=3053513 RepID=UPI0025753413|nr:hypothetical protein [Variovorax sp. J22P168]MDM0013552.1 hypothetical protein [Variovorax sp. J22P168]